MVYNNYSDFAVDGIVSSSLQGNLMGVVTWDPTTDTTYVAKLSGCSVLYNGTVYTSNGTTWSVTPITSNITVDSALSATSTNPVQNKVIKAVIPDAATSSNQLADKAFVNSSISTSTATFRGTFNVTDLGLTTSATTVQVAAALPNYVSGATLNDYVFVYFDLSSDPGNIDRYERYKVSAVSGATVTWSYEYTLNNSSFTADQWAAINSGITTNGVSNIATALSTANTAVAGLTDGSVTKVGTATVGGTAKPIYLNAGAPTALSGNIGSTTQPVYIASGTITAGTALSDGAYKAMGSITSDNTGLVTGGAIYTSLDAKLDKTGTAAKATADASGNTITTTYQTKVKTATITVPTSGGAVTVTGMTTTALVWVSPAPASFSVYTTAGCYCSAQAANSLTFTVTKTATEAMSVNVAWCEP